MKPLTCLALLLLLTGFRAHAGLEASDTRESLRGLNGVFVLVQLVDEQPAGLTTNGLETLVKSALADAGITADARPKKLNGDANLTIVVDTLKQTQLDAYIFTVEVVVTQEVQLTRPMSSKASPGMSAQTWRRSIQGMTTPDRVDIIEQAVKQGLNVFIADYRAVNPPSH